MILSAMRVNFALRQFHDSKYPHRQQRVTSGSEQAQWAYRTQRTSVRFRLTTSQSSQYNFTTSAYGQGCPLVNSGRRPRHR